LTNGNENGLGRGEMRMTRYEKNSPPNYDEPAPPETLRRGGGFLRVAGFMLATLIGILIGVGSTLAWQIYGDQLRALLPQPQQTASQRRNIATDLEDMKKTIQQLEGSDQRLTQTISWLQSSQQEIQRELFLRQTEIRQLSDEMAFLRSRFENAEKLAPAPAPGSSETEHDALIGWPRQSIRGYFACLSAVEATSRVCQHNS
jgi:uncharacterized protein HemX